MAFAANIPNSLGKKSTAKKFTDLTKMKIPISGFSGLSKSIVQVKGPDASKFLNGLITSRLSPTIVKKKQHTIDKVDRNLPDIVDVHTNWGVLHQDIYDPDEEIYVRRDGIYTMFLNSKGRVNTDLFLFAYPYHSIDAKADLDDWKCPNYLVEIDSKYTSKLLTLLRLHKLSSKVEIKQHSNIHSYYYYNDDFLFDDWLTELMSRYMSSKDPQSAVKSANELSAQIFSEEGRKKVIGFAVDNRIPNFGIKILTNAPLDDPHEIFSSDFAFPLNVAPEDVIINRRFINGLFETLDTPEGPLLPFECNLDFVNGLSLEKGCYVGQELTIRTFNNGTIRKRIMPFQFFDLDDPHVTDHMTLIESDPVMSAMKDMHVTNLLKLEVSSVGEVEEDSGESALPFSPFGSAPVRRRKTSLGKILAIRENVGFILINVDDLQKHNYVYKIEVPAINGTKEIGIKVFKPEWWPEEEE